MQSRRHRSGNRSAGENRYGAKLTNHDVLLVRELRESYGIAYQEIAEKFDVSKSLIVKICRYEKRVSIYELF